MKVLDVCKNYFNGFQEAFYFRKNNSAKNILAALKVISYFTVVIPLGFAIAYGAASLYGRVSKKQDLSPHDKSINDRAKITLLKKDSSKDIPPPIEPSNRQSAQVKENPKLELGTTTSETEQLEELDLEMEKVAKKEQDVKERTEFGINLPMQQLIASINSIEISGIATALIADVMDRLWVDIEVTNEPMRPGTIYAMAKKYNKESVLMKFLLPICTDIITKSLASPWEFAEKGIVFDFLNSSKTGLLDQVKNEALKKQIVSGMRSDSTFSMTLKAKEGKTLKLEIEQYLDGEWIARQTSTVKSLLEVAETGLL